ncbi:uncharacterized protein LOC111014131 [Momordica charantia]|uniref:Uncharacterized protein LOC111014131 n=1 Tax=Momordica charantia TaxID=3673 RepID=A0A6J1CT99_MOMCH|nr:uncharacterized protein LOC111014131 [Momordica charantia]
MGHTLIVSLQFPNFIFSPHLRTRTHTSRFHHENKQTFLCFALNGDQNPPLFSLEFSRRHPLFESSKASFDEYIEDEVRVLRATFAGKSEQLADEDEWRIHMPSFQLLFFKVNPVVDVRFICRSSAKDYPIHIPPHISKFLELQLMRWELNGLGGDFKSQSFKISVKGALYAERRESKSKLRYYLVLNLHSFAAPTPLAFIPQDVFLALAQKGLKGMMEEAMDDFSEKLLLDYTKFKEKLKE